MRIKVGEAITYPPSKYHFEHYVNGERVADKIVMKTNGYFKQREFWVSHSSAEIDGT